MPPARKPKVWYDKHRKCEDGSEHEGELELITWNGKSDDGQQLGWGAVMMEEAEDHKRSFETKYGGDQERFYEWWPQGFRWTCCGCTGDMPWGCDHHGKGSKPCKCDFCVMGKPLPANISPITSQQRVGLTLSRGPDPRSHNPAQAAISEVMRSLFGMDNDSASGSGGQQKPKAKTAAKAAAAKAPAAAGNGAGKGKAGAASGSAAASSSSGSAAASSSKAPAVAGGKQGSAAGAGAAAAAPAVKRECAVCGKDQQADGKSLMKCGACKSVRYCGADCQAAHWPSHKPACKELLQLRKQAALSP
ncbi:hypothetical protein HXX76_000088 [Chlamydomonas incerta]|uniref:MYND-type domain-containing protein n=1 Tax=Chlamydomonas incerta TaxID=51695 RepID=A0A835WDW1_CHLIN|nr:hypothetical protein HXX76_000088 [Chlamydomonas incerta]|eukprot:KAG2445471.1 hypothetical protein HXX76_000088 [Chlamydomonas incerta]